MGVDLDGERLAAARAVLDRASRGGPGRHRRHRPDRAEEREQRRDVVRADIEDRRLRPVRRGTRGSGGATRARGLTKNALAPTISPSRPSSMRRRHVCSRPPMNVSGALPTRRPAAVGDGQELDGSPPTSRRAASRNRRACPPAERGHVRATRGRPGVVEVEDDRRRSASASELAQTVAYAFGSPCCGRLASSLVEVAAGAADHADDVAVARQVREVDVADVADPHDPDAERVHVLRAPRPGAPGGVRGGTPWRRRRCASPGGRRAACTGFDLATREAQERQQLGPIGRLEPRDERGPRLPGPVRRAGLRVVWLGVRSVRPTVTASREPTTSIRMS